MSEELKPCPMCGGEAREFHGVNGIGNSVECLSCGVSISKPNIDDAIKAWNRRADHIVDATAMIQAAQKEI